MSNEKRKIEIYTPKTPYELDQAQKAKNEAWGFLNLSPEEGSIRTIYDRFPEGFLTAFVNGEAAANLTTMRTHYDVKNPVPTWTGVTDNGRAGNHIPDGETLYGVSMGVSPRFRGDGIGTMLFYKAQELTIKLGCKQFVGGCRIPDYHKYSEIPVDQYILLKRQDGEYLDKELRFYSRCGMRFLKPMPEYMSGTWGDPESLNYGVLLIWSNPYYQK